MVTATVLQHGAVSTIDYRCDAGPAETAFTEQHAAHSISYVRRGTFGYRSGGRSFDLVAGSILIGHAGDEFICTHDHHVCGDECLSFHLTADFVGTIADTPTIWRAGALPPTPQLIVLGELAQATADGKTDIGLDEVGMLLIAGFLELVSTRKSGSAKNAREAHTRDRRRAVQTALWMDANSHEELDLEHSAKIAGLSTFHFLRVFADVIGVTPHQYLIRSRLRHAARLLSEPDISITDIALQVGFADLSNFVRTFHRAAGVSPRRFRQSTRNDRRTLAQHLAKSCVGAQAPHILGR